MTLLKVRLGWHSAVPLPSSTVHSCGSNRLLRMVECSVAPGTGSCQEEGCSAGGSRPGAARVPSLSRKMPW
jgi:hypothetical protein